MYFCAIESSRNNYSFHNAYFRYESEWKNATPIRANLNNAPVAIKVTGYEGAVLTYIECVQCDKTSTSHPNNCFFRENGVNLSDILNNGGKRIITKHIGSLIYFLL